ncbi:MAG TPA: SRPBCC family protein [Conexibacter sp.]
MTVQTDRIERDVVIAAPVERVWQLITSAEHLGAWFGDAGAEIDLRPGGALSLHWNEHPTVHGRVETIEPPHRFAYRWLTSADAQEATPGNSTLVEFTLVPEGDGTRVALVESGFDGLDLDRDARVARFEAHTGGWPFELGHLAEHATRVPEAR